MTTRPSRPGLRAWTCLMLLVLLVGIAGCGSGTSAAGQRTKEASPFVETTTSDPSSTTSTPSSAAASEPNTEGTPSFTADVSTAAGDKVSVEGWFGPVVPASQSSVNQTTLDECPQPAPDGKAMIAQLDITTTVQSSLPTEVELQTAGAVIGYDRSYPRPNFIVGYSEGPKCFNGQAGEVNLKLGKLQPEQANSSTMWIVLPNAISPNRPDPSEQQLGKERWLMGPVLPVITDGTGSASENPNATHAHVSGPRLVTCEQLNGIEHERLEYLAVSGHTPRTLVNEATCPKE